MGFNLLRAICIPNPSYDCFEASDASIEAMNGQFLCNRPISVSYAFKKDSKGDLISSPECFFHHITRGLAPIRPFSFPPWSPLRRASRYPSRAIACGSTASQDGAAEPTAHPVRDRAKADTRVHCQLPFSPPGHDGSFGLCSRSHDDDARTAG